MTRDEFNNLVFGDLVEYQNSDASKQGRRFFVLKAYPNEGFVAMCPFEEIDATRVERIRGQRIPVYENMTLVKGSTGRS